ncbi:MAG: hypothetical protein ABSC45_04765 [Desulfobaccales bacterium]|jgi:hypothetical protein
MALVLNPEVKLRQDGGRAILFSLNAPGSISDGVFAFIYPQQAITLALFDGHHEIEEIKETIAYLFSIDDL